MYFFLESSIYLLSYQITDYSPLAQVFRKINMNTRLQENIVLQKCGRGKRGEEASID